MEIASPGQACGDADGFWTRLPDMKVNVVTADCVPILLYRTDGKAVAALHAGWRGTYARISERFFQSLPEEWSHPGDWHAMLGPSIKADCYEVSEELILRFKAEFPDLDPHVIEPTYRRLDVTAVNEHQLRKLGVASTEIHPDCSRCTQTAAGEFKYCSYRRGDRHSRQFSWITR
ncbi:MAG: polyphenol oxidase family protein [Bdellovibrionales bacterium]|nr:polyphenol oxidase family protein [Bdellovibrionales bacterium]